MRTVRRLRLRFLLLRPGNPNPTAFTLPSCPLCYSLPCRNYAGPLGDILLGIVIPDMDRIRTCYSTRLGPTLTTGVHITIYLLVDLGGFAPPSRTLFSLLHTAITYSIYLFFRLVNCFGDDIIHLCIRIGNFVQLGFGH
jgi:hypothetical protein